MSIEAMKQAQPVEFEKELINLLCRIHRDGGHYIAEHGLHKAINDAQIKIAKLNVLSDTPTPPRQPLTDEEIDELSRTMVKGNRSVNWLARAIEAAHGIKGEA